MPVCCLSGMRQSDTGGTAPGLAGEERTGIIIAEGIEPEDPAGPGRRKANGVLAGEEGLTVTAEATDLSKGLTLSSGDNTDAIGTELGMQVPHLPGATDETRSRGWIHAVKGRRQKRCC